MKKFFLTLLATTVSFSLFAQLTNEQVLEVIRRASAEGLSQTEIVAELARRGVTTQQLLSLREAAQSASSDVFGISSMEEATSRLRTDPRNKTRDESDTYTNQTSTNARLSSTGLSSLTLAGRLGNIEPGELDTIDSIVLGTLLRRKTAIFGHNIFSGKGLTFEPSLNIATPGSYLLGPGDEVIVDIWGDSEQTIREDISPDGTIVIGQLGPVTLGGLTVSEADARLKRALAGIYSSADGSTPSTFIKLSLGQIRTIQVHVMGEVEYPGTYTLPSLATLFHVLYSAGGVNDIGSLREIAVNREGRRVATVDVYSYLLEGRSDVDIALREGDIVIVPPWRNLVEVAGKVKRPMKYEMRDGQTLASLLDYSGGFTGDAHKEAVTVIRPGGDNRMRQVFDVARGDYSRFVLIDADSVSVGGVIERFSNRLEISGAVYRPGLYSMTDSINSIYTLIERAGGLMGDAFLARGVLTREKPDYSLEALSIDVGAIMTGIAPDMPLRNGDVLHISSIFDLHEKYTVTILGEVQKPGVYEFADNLTIEDMIIRAGGLLESASTAKADVSRRIKIPSSISESETRSESYSFPIRHGLTVGEGAGFALLPFDVVTIRTSPGYEVQKPVAVMGEVLFPGDYTLVKREERLSDLMHMAGGALSTAYLKGAKLIRKRAEDEQTRAQSALRLAGRGGGPDSLSSASLNVEQNYSVGIELDKAMASPGSDFDLVLSEGDVLFVPGYVGTVAISGAVLFPNTVSFREGMRIGDYIDQAGGYAHRARRRSKFVIYMNGTIARAKGIGSTMIAPGCEIVVPYKSYRNGARLSLAEILSLGASTASTASLVSSLMNTLK
ncbi:MAG: SLBB domain-containing protein [Alistipes sp.]|jgi:protein involved in polysaccharide export with SLBB domain|nr:SLBB domain-containing protein [Alistipes sp.]